ncbi:MAG: hypothetical protein IJX17_05245, partial [Clostridia bacterium]|nr:hypothetical protein [Clostridia bacterium]
MEDFVQNINHQFYDYVLKYDLTNDNIIRKIVHTNTVADTCFTIACKMGLNKNEVEIWEDGMRTDGSKGTYEWWYFDSHYPDGTILVIFFF